MISPCWMTPDPVKSNDEIPTKRKNEQLPQSKNPINSFIGSYEELGVLGSGSFGRVIKAKAKSNVDGSPSSEKTKIVAIKIISGRHGKYEIEVLEKLKTVDPLNTQRYVQLESSYYDAHYQVYYIVFPLLGLDLATYQANHGKFTLSYIRIITSQILTCLEFLHSHRIVHCDIKPDNILFENAECYEVFVPETKSWNRYIKKPLVRLTDFGLAESIDTKYNDKRIIQTRPYRGPEIILRLGWNEKSDIWALGATIFFLWKGKDLIYTTHSDTYHAGILDKLFGPFPKCMISSKSSRYFDPNGGINMTEAEKDQFRNNYVVKFQDYDDFQNEDSQSLFSLMKGMMELCPNKRMTATEALGHEFFAELKNNNSGIFHDLSPGIEKI